MAGAAAVLSRLDVAAAFRIGVIRMAPLGSASCNSFIVMAVIFFTCPHYAWREKTVCWIFGRCRARGRCIGHKGEYLRRSAQFVWLLMGRIGGRAAQGESVCPRFGERWGESLASDDRTAGSVVIVWAVGKRCLPSGTGGDDCLGWSLSVECAYLIESCTAMLWVG